MAPLLRTPDQENVRHLELPATLVKAMHPLEPPAQAVEPAQDAPSSDAASLPIPELPHVARANNPWRMYVAPEVFAERYANASLDELKARKNVLAEEVPTRILEEGIQYLDSGGGEVEVKERPGPDELIMKDGDGQKSYGLIQGQRAQLLSSGELLVETAALPWEEHVSLYDAQDELTWLTGELIRRKREATAENAGDPSDG